MSQPLRFIDSKGVRAVIAVHDACRDVNVRLLKEVDQLAEDGQPRARDPAELRRRSRMMMAPNARPARPR
jgi:hypothetical protein